MNNVISPSPCSFSPNHNNFLLASISSPLASVFISNVELTVIFFGAREIIHGYAQTVIFALQVTLDGIGDCQVLKHVTLKNLVIDDIVVDSKLEVLTINCFLSHSGEG